MNNFALIIEDDYDLSVIFAEALKAADYETEIIRDGLAGQQRLKEVIPHVVVLDMHLPNVDGMTLFDQIRADEKLAQTTVIIATADAVTGDLYSDRADFVLIKPISFSQLRDLTARLAAK